MYNLYNDSAHAQHSELCQCIFILEEQVRDLSNMFRDEQCETKSFLYLVEHRRVRKQLEELRDELIRFENINPEFRTIS